jgi:hypothetical protein
MSINNAAFSETKRAANEKQENTKMIESVYHFSGKMYWN